MMFHDSYNFWGMHLIWWGIWGIMLFWIFATPYHIPGQRFKPEKPLDILKRRYAAGELTTDDYNERKKELRTEIDSSK